MAYCSKEDKAEVSAKILPLLKKFGIKGSLSVNNHSSLVLTLWSGPIDFIENFNQNAGKFYNSYRNFEPITSGHMEINEYHYKDSFSGECLEILEKLIPAMYTSDWFCDDDIMSDYFNRAYYIYVYVGRYNKPYKLTTPKNEKVIAMTEYSNHSISEICEEINTLREMSTKIATMKSVDINPIIANLSDMATEIEKELKERMTSF